MRFIKLPDPAFLQKLDFKNPATWIATWFGSGLMHPAPGTWGSLAAMPVGMILLALGKPALLIGLVAVFAIGLWATREFEKMTGEHDSGIIVIDEVAGIFITLLASTLAPLSILLAFVLFRFFDILKPWPVGMLDKKVPGAWGVMLDDVAAGIYAAITLYLVNTYALAG